MPIVDHPAFRIYTEQRLYDDELPLNKSTPDLEFHRRPIDDPAPYIVVVQGPRNVGKSLLIESLKTRTLVAGINKTRNLVTVPVMSASASGKDIRLQFVECSSNIADMIDAAKYADVAILMVDASYGFEMVIGVLTHLDKVDEDDEMLEVELRRLEHHFCTEICEGARVFSLSGLEDGLHRMLEIHNLMEMLSDSDFLPSSWRAKHPYMLAEHVHMCQDGMFNTVSLSGYLRGGDIKTGDKVSIAGSGDFSVAGVTRSCYDPFDPLERQFKRKTYLTLIIKANTGKKYQFDLPGIVLVGVITPEEEKTGFMLVKIRRHSWHKNLLMSGVPIPVSAGWRRYKTNAIYAMENENGQLQFLTKTPEHKDCLAVIWGPLAPSKTTIVVGLNKFYCSKNKEAFQIMAKGVVLDLKHDAQILLEVGRIAAIDHSGKEARVVFKPILFIDRFRGLIETKSGIRGVIAQTAEKWVYKCTFENNIPSGDTIVFPVSATLVLPSVFQRLNFLVKPLELAIQGSVDATAAAVSIANAAAVAVDASIAASFTASLSIFPGKKMLRVSYKEVPVKQHRRRVAIHEGECGFVSVPNPLELFYSSVELEPRVDREVSGEVEEKHSIQELERRVDREVSGEVEEKHSLDPSGVEARVRWLANMPCFNIKKRKRYVAGETSGDEEEGDDEVYGGAILAM